MAKTIEERLDQWIHDDAFAVCAADTKTAATAADMLKAAIIEEWNAAIKTMKAFVDRELDADGCSYCDNDAESDHSPWCLVPQFQAIIAQMEGTSPSRDEAMVEDKRYERNDIFKK